MKKIRVLLLIAFVATIIVVLRRSDNNSAIDDRISHYPDIFAHECQCLERPLNGSEGILHNTGLQLKGLVVLFRHGERSPLQPVTSHSQSDCTAFHEVDRHAFEKYHQLVHNDLFKKHITVDPFFKNYPVTPERSKCQLGNITAEGALQLLRLGNYLRSKYEHTDILNDGYDATVLVSPYIRTFQSAIAFTSGFFYKKQTSNFPAIHLKACKNTYFCTESNCACKKIEGYRRDFYEMRANLYLKKYADLHARLMAVVKEFGLEIHHPLEFVDFVLGRYGCRRLPLPCPKGNNCISLDIFNEALTAVDELLRSLYPSPEAINMRKLFSIESLPIAKAVVSVIQGLRKNSNTPIIRVFSGHDISILPLTFSLNLNVSHYLPPYGSRLVFEIYELKQKVEVIEDSFFVRVILNGVDHTQDLPFCQNLYNGSCSAHYFERFVQESLLQKLADIPSANDICS